MIRSRADQLLELLANLLRSAVNAGGVRAGGVVIDDAVPAVQLVARSVGALVDGQEHALGDRKRPGIAPSLLEMLAEERDRSLEVGVGGAASAHPGVGQGGGAADGVGMSAAEPDRRMWLLHGP